VRAYERSGFALAAALRTVVLDPAAGCFDRRTAAQILAIAGEKETVDALLDSFFAQTERIEHRARFRKGF
jgi:hypothetical protein